MEFCSKYGYDYGFDGSDSESVEEEDQVIKSKVTKKVRKVDSNVIAVKFDELVNSNETFAGEPKRCKTCQAIVSPISLPNIKQKNNKFIWECEFCETVNDLSEQMLQNLDEIPKNDDVTYLIEPAPEREEAAKESKAKKIESTDDKYLNYCIDISGSMDTEIPVNLDANNNSTVDKHMSRLKGVKVACLENLTYLKDSEPNKKVSLVTFSDCVKFYGDGTKSSLSNPLVNTSNNRNDRSQQYQQQTSSNLFSRMFRLNTNPNNNANTLPSNNTQEIAYDILQNQEKMLALGQNQNSDLKGVSDSYTGLKNIIQDLRTEGSTALGPALVFSIGYLTGKDGSQIILCTDGAANVGMGAIENYGGSNDSYEFYDKLADYAKSKNITVNIITMEGTDCKLALLGRVADKTNGTMHIVNPAKLSDEFKSILDNRIVATSVKATLIVNHRYLYIRDIELEEEETKVASNRDENLDRLDNLKKSKLVKDIGNANLDTEITFEYGIRRQKEKSTIEKLDEMPFQLQIEYVHNGAKLTRVYTKKQKFTKEKSEAVNNILDRNVLWMGNMQKMSEHALNSNVQYSKMRAQAISNFARKNHMAMIPTMQNNIEECYNLETSNARNYNDKQSVNLLAFKKAGRNFFSSSKK